MARQELRITSDQPRHDIVAEGPAGDVRLIVETKAKQGTNEDWATAFHFTLATAWNEKAPLYFLLALPDKFYLWDPETSHLAVRPKYVADSAAVLGPYLESIGSRKARVSSMAFELAVQAWMQDLIQRLARNEKPAESETWVEQSGLGDVLRGAHLVYESAA